MVPTEPVNGARLDRELNELLQELRVIQGGILLLVGFLLVIAFSAGFADASDFQRVVYYLTLLVTGVAAIVVVAPVVHHRLAFRRRDKERVVVRGNHQVVIAIMLVALSILGILTLVTDYLFNRTLTVVIDVLYAGLVTIMGPAAAALDPPGSQRPLTRHELRLRAPRTAPWGATSCASWRRSPDP